MDSDLPVYNNSYIKAFGTCTIPLLSPVSGKIHDTEFYIAKSIPVSYLVAKTHFSCSWYSHMTFHQNSPKGAFPISRAHDTVYTNFIKHNKQETHYQAQQKSPVPASKLTMPLGQPSPIDDTLPKTFVDSKTK